MSRRRLLAASAAIAVLLLAGAGAWHAAQPAHSPTPRDRAVAVEHQLRCPTCQGLSVADSPSPIAAGMRQEIEAKLAAGDTPAQVRAYFVARYSDWILLDPPRRGIGWVVWAAPALLIIGGLLLLRRTLRRRRTARERVVDPADLAAADRFAADMPEQADLPEPVAAALTDLYAARVDAGLDADAQTAADDALARLAEALHDQSAVAPAPPADANHDIHAEIADTPDTAETPNPTGSVAAPRRRRARYAVPAAAVVFAGLLAITLAHAVAHRPAGAVPTGDFATALPRAAPMSSAPAADLGASRRATTTRPNDPAAWLAYATALDKAGQLAAAEPNYRKTLALDPSNVAAREQLGWLLTRGGSPTEALNVLDPLAQQRPNDPQVVLLVGLAQRGAGQSDAAATLRHYLELAPDTAAAAMVRALLGGTR